MCSRSQGQHRRSKQSHLIFHSFHRFPSSSRTRTCSVTLAVTLDVLRSFCPNSLDVKLSLVCVCLLSACGSYSGTYSEQEPPGRKTPTVPNLSFFFKTQSCLSFQGLSHPFLLFSPAPPPLLSSCLQFFLSHRFVTFL